MSLSLLVKLRDFQLVNLINVNKRIILNIADFITKKCYFINVIHSFYLFIASLRPILKLKLNFSFYWSKKFRVKGQKQNRRLNSIFEK